MDKHIERRPRSTRTAWRAVALALVGSAMGLAGCTGQKLAKLTICDGKHLRPANPYGSILPGAPIPATTVPAGPGSPIAAGAPPATAGTRTSSSSAVAAYPSC